MLAPVSSPRTRRPVLRLMPGLTLLVLLACAAVGSASGGGRAARVAVFPVENLTGHGVPTNEVRQALMDRLAAAGVGILETDAVDAFMTRRRVRYAAGIDGTTATALREETGADNVVFASVELSNDAVPPKVALMIRLVSIGADPVVVWADDASMAGDDAPGLFAVGLINDHQILFGRALNRLADSLLAYLETGEPGTRPKSASRFRPKMYYRSRDFDTGKTYGLAVLPFVNLSGRRNAGEILAALFVRHLSGSAQFRVADTGVARRQLLDARIIMDGGPSIADAETVAALIDADLVLGGRVFRYDDFEGEGGTARVEFSAVLIERRSRKVVWSSDSYNDGRERLGFFERGVSTTAHAMATQMVRLTAEMMAGRDR